MIKKLRPLRLPVALLAVAGLSGCTIFPEQKNPSLAQTTSAEQNERIFWQMTRAQQWEKLSPLLAANLVWIVPGKTMGRDDIVPYLEALGVADYTMTGVTVKPNGPDMTVAYTLQIASKPGGSQATNLAVVSVWQQVKGGWVLILRSEQAA